jgi:hypothetical protein
MDTLKINGRCHVCNVTESLEHIALQCYSLEQKNNMVSHTTTVVKEIFLLANTELGVDTRL